MDMDIVGMAFSMKQANITNQVGAALLSKSLDSMETLGEGMVDIISASAMQASVSPHLGQNIDVSI